MRNAPRIFVVCSGLGRVSRGYESFFRDCFDFLKRHPKVDLFLFKGEGMKGYKETPLWNMPRDGTLAKGIGRMLRRSGYFVEQCTFFLSLFPHILLRGPDVVYVSDVVLGNLLRKARNMTPKRFAVLFNNNGPTSPNFLARYDHIQQVSPEYFNQATARGIAREKQTLLPSAVPIPRALSILEAGELAALRQRLGLPTVGRIVLSVGALSNGRKRMEYVIREVAALPEPRPFLLLLGQAASDTADIVRLGNTLLSQARFKATTVPKDVVADYYACADVFVLASMDEGFGLVYVEALSHGLPCLVHDYETARFVLGPMGTYGDLSKDGALASMLVEALNKSAVREDAIARHAYAYETFSWGMLEARYLSMFCECARNTAKSVF